MAIYVKNQEKDSLNSRIKELKNYGREINDCVMHNEENKISMKILMVRYWDSIKVIQELEKALQEINNLTKLD